MRLEHDLNPPRDEAEEREQEAEANRLAAEILLPADQFVPQSHRSLTELKQAFPFASHEVLPAAA